MTNYSKMTTEELEDLRDELAKELMSCKDEKELARIDSEIDEIWDEIDSRDSDLCESMD